MAESPGISGALVRSSLVGTVLQLVMVITGHFVPQIAPLFPIVGTGISAVAGLLFSRWSTSASPGVTAGGGALAGGVSAIIGIAASMMMKDVPASTLGIGTASSAVAGVVGSLAGRFLTARTRA